MGPTTEPTEPTEPTVETRWLDSTEIAAWRSFIHGTRHLFAALDQDPKPHGLSGDDYGVLVALSDSPDNQLRMADLAEQSAQSRSRLSHHVARLEDRGLVERISCPEDRRGQYAVLTARGRELLEQAAPHHVASVRTHFLDHLGPHDLETLGAVFGRLYPSPTTDPN